MFPLSFANMLGCIEMVLTRLKIVNLSIKPRKCIFPNLLSFSWLHVIYSQNFSEARKSGQG